MLMLIFITHEGKEGEGERESESVSSRIWQRTGSGLNIAILNSYQIRSAVDLIRVLRWEDAFIYMPYLDLT